MAESNSNFTIEDLMNSRNVNIILDSNPDNFVEVSASYLGTNAIQIGIRVNCRVVSTQTYILDAHGEFNLANIVQIDRSEPDNLNRREIRVVYNREVVYTYLYRVPRQPATDSSSDEEDAPPSIHLSSSDDDDDDVCPPTEDAGAPSTSSAGTTATPADAPTGTAAASTGTASSTGTTATLADASTGTTAASTGTAAAPSDGGSSSGRPSAAQLAAEASGPSGFGRGFLPGVDTPFSPMQPGVDTPFSPIHEGEADLDLNFLPSSDDAVVP